MNEFCHELAYRSMSEEKRAALAPSSKFAIDLSSGITAGFAAAILSQVRPASPISPSLFSTELIVPRL